MALDKTNHLLLKLSKLTCVDEGELPETYREITESLVSGLGVQRASIWFYTPEEKSIACRDLFQEGGPDHSKGIELFKSDFPAYFEYLSEERTLPVSDALTHPATREFTDPYLLPNNIFSMLDAPIRLNGKMIGVICCETVGASRIWTSTDELFVGNVSDIISRALQANQRSIAHRKLEDMNQYLEILVEERTLQLEEQRARAAHVSKMASLGEMAGSIAHEINNPLAIIIGLTLQIRRRHETDALDSENLLRLLSALEDTSLRIEKVVRGLRFFAREGSFEDKKEAVLFQIIEDTLALCEEKLRILNCKVHIEIPRNLKVLCSPVGISQVILNLVSNAVDALQNSETKWIKISAEATPAGIHLRISDSGEGIPENIRDQIMMPFFTTKPVGKGTGLGLAIAKGIVEQHKGSFSLDTKLPYTTFLITLPKSA